MAYKPTVGNLWLDSFYHLTVDDSNSSSIYAGPQKSISSNIKIMPMTLFTALLMPLSNIHSHSDNVSGNESFDLMEEVNSSYSSGISKYGTSLEVGLSVDWE